jgi:hypothetical protein
MPKNETLKETIEKNVGFAGWILGANSGTEWADGNLEALLEKERERDAASDRRIANGDETEKLRRALTDGAC